MNHSFTISQAGQTIAFGALSNQPFSAGPYPVGATASSGLTVSLASTTPSVCTVSGTNVTTVALGTCTIQATQAGNGSTYAAAAPVNQSFMVTQSSQTIGFTTASAVYGQNGSFTTIGAAAGAGGLSGPSGVAQDSNGNLYVADALNSRVLFYPAGSATATQVYGQGGSFTSGSCNLGGVSATSLCSPTGVAIDSSGNLYVADYGNSRVLIWSNASSASNGTAANLVLGQSSFTTAAQGAGANQLYNPYGLATDGSGNLYVADTKNNRAVLYVSASTLTNGANATTVFGQSGFGPNANGGGATGLYSPWGVAPDGSGNLYVSDSVNSRVLFYSNAVTASNGEAATEVYGQSSFSGVESEGGVGPTAADFYVPRGVFVNGSGTLYVADAANNRVLGFNGQLPNQAYGAAPFSIGASASSGLAVSFASTTTGVCTVSGSTVTLVTGGTCTVQATQAGNTDYAAATPVNQSFTVTPLGQTITFGALSDQVYGTAAFAIGATDSANLTVSFNSQTTPVCTVSGTTVTLVSAGTCTIQATQAGNSTYAAAAPVDQSFQATQASQAITLVTSPVGLLVSVDGGTAQAAPFTVSLSAGAHTVSAAVIQAGSAGTQYAFTGWSDAGTASHSITVASSPATYTASFQTQYQLTTGASPAAGGTITPATGAFYNMGSSVTVQAAGNAGYQFGSFSGGLTGTVNPQSVTMNGPVTVVANYTPLAPQLAATVGTRTVSGATLLVNLTLTNSGAGAATNATISSITAITDIVGSGVVTVASGVPVDLGTINTGTNAQTTVTFNWPSSATRVSFKVTFTADGGYSNSTTITTVY